jgi:Glycosyltransferase
MSSTAVILIGFLPNPRIKKRIEFEKSNMNLHLICWDRGSEMQMVPSGNGYEVHRIEIAARNNPLKRMVPYRKFSKKAMEILMQVAPDLIHVQGLDMLKIACNYKQHSKKTVRIIYEIADLHRLIIDKQRNMAKLMVQKYFQYADRRCCENIDLLIVTSQKYVERYFGAFVPAEKIMYFPNVPDLNAFREYHKKRNREPFRVGFIGDIRYPQQMKNLITAAKRCDMEVLFAGFEQGGNEIENLCKEYSKGEWFGKFDFKKQGAMLYEKCDVIYSVYDADMENVRVALPNKLYEAVYCEVPIIVAKNTYLADIVEEWDVGVAVDHRSPDELIKVLHRLSNDLEYYKHFAINCLKYKDEVDLKKYNEQLKRRLMKLNIETDFI